MLSTDVVSRILWLVTGFGDATLLLPASAVLFAAFLWQGSRRGAALWGSSLALCVVLTLLGKIAFRVCDAWPALMNIRSPSGHTSLSMTFYLCCAVAVSAHERPPVRTAVTAAGALLVAAIAASRILLGLHTSAEVLAGLLIGAVSVAWFAAHYLDYRIPTLRWQPLLAATLVMLALAQLMHLDFEHWIVRLAQMLRRHIACG